MCRYAFKKYKPRYVCFDCRKTFKQPTIEDMVWQNGDWEVWKQAFLSYNAEICVKFRNENPELVSRFEEQYRNKKYKCPDCGNEMNSIGLDFKAPKKDKIREWEIVRSMYRLGNTFHTCGGYGPGFIPHKTTDYLIHLEATKAGYSERLNYRNPEWSASQLTDYLDYWHSKLQMVTEEIRKNRP